MDEMNSIEENLNKKADIPSLLLPRESESPKLIEEEDNDVLEIESENEKESLLTKAKRTVKICLPHIFLQLFLAGYILIGATYFYYHESAYEAESKTQELVEFFQFQNQFCDKILDFKSSNHSLTTTSAEENLNKIKQGLFNEFASHIFRLKKSYSLTEKDSSNEISIEKTQIWTFSNSVFFATMILSTIGYGSSGLQPATIFGKIGCIFFALIGIPLFYITMCDAAKWSSEYLIYFYEKYLSLKKKIFKTIQKLICPSSEIKHVDPEDDDYYPEIPLYTEILIFIAYIAFIGLLIKLCKGWSFMEAFFVSFLTMTTIGFGNELPSKNDSIFLIFIAIIFGISIKLILIDSFCYQYKQIFGHFHRYFKKISNCRKCHPVRQT